MITSIRTLTNERARRRELRMRQLQQERDAREAHVFARIPRLAEIKEIQTNIGLDLARLLLKVPTRYNRPFEELESWSKQLSAERVELMARHGIDPYDLEVHWDCPLCKNTGWLEPEKAGEDTVYPAQKCRCLVQEEIEDLYRFSGLTGPLREQTFARFDLTVYPAEVREHMRRVLGRAKSYADQVAQGEGAESLLLSGNVGVGKTFLSSAIANQVVSAGKAVVYFTFSEFMDLIRLHKFEDDEQYRTGVQRLLEADLIVLDDLGAERVTDFVAQELFNIVNHRLNRNLPMVVSTNLSPGELEEVYGARIASRLLGSYEFLPLKGDDVRRVLRQRRSRMA